MGARWWNERGWINMSSDHGPNGTPGGLYVKVKRRDIKKGS